MPRPATTGSAMPSFLKENKPVWCSPGRPYSTLLRAGKGKPLGDVKPGNRLPSLDGPGKSERALDHVELKKGNRSQSLDGPGKGGMVLRPAAKKAPEQKSSPGRLKSGIGVRAPSQVSAGRVPSPVTDPPMDPLIAKQNCFDSRSNYNPGRYNESYSKLRSWVHSSLDTYKNELLRILYPVYVHSFMDLMAKGFSQEARTFFETFREDHEVLHLRDLQKLERVLAPQGLEETGLAPSFLENKIGIRMCQNSIELLLQYLRNTDLMLILGIINEHINLQVFPAQPSPLLEEEEAKTLTGKAQEALDLVNQKEILWGVVENSLEEKLAKELPAGAEKGEIEEKNAETNDTQKRTAEGAIRSGKVVTPAVKKAPEQKNSPRTLKSRIGVRTPSQVPGVRVPSPVTSRPKTTKAPVTEATPPRTGPSKKPVAAQTTPTNRFRKPLTTAGTPKNSVSKVSTPKGGTAKGSTPGSRARERIQANDVTPARKTRERPRAGAAAAAQEIPKSGSRDNRGQQQQGYSGWAGAAAGRGRKSSPTHARPPVKHLFLSPQVSKKTAKRDFVRKSIENGIWVGPGAQRKRAPAPKRDVDSEMPPPAQPTSSPEIPKRGSREASGEGIRGYFGAGHMVAPEGVGFVRDRRKCKPRGTLMIGQEGLSMESDSSDIVEASVQMPPPSAASVEWMMNNDGKEGDLNDFSSGSLHEPLSTSLSEFTVRDNQVSELFGEDRTSHEGVCDEGIEQLRLSSSTDVYSKFTERSQAFLRHLEMRQSQLSRAVSFSHVRGPRQYSRGESLRSTEQLGFGYSDLEYEDSSVDWRQGLPAESLEMMEVTAAVQDSGGKNEELLRSSLSFTSSWAPHSQDSRPLYGHAKTWYDPDSPWYGFSPITPEFHRNSQLPDGGSKAIDALLAGSVRRRIMTDQSPSSDKLDTSCTSINQSMQLVEAGESSSGLSSNSSQDTSSSFQFARNSYASGSVIDMEPMPLDNFMCQTSSPIERSPYSADNICQTASPIDEVYNVACSIDCSVACSIDCSVDCSIDCTVNGSDDDEVEYASPTMGDYLSPVKSSPPLAKSAKISLCDDINAGARAMRRSSISRTLDELMRHNFML